MDRQTRLRREIARTLDHYYELERELQQLEAGHFRVCIFGSARIRPEDPTYRQVYELAHMLAGLRIDIVTGGGPGLMEAANRAAQDACGEGSRSFGLTIELPRLKEVANRHLDIKSEHRRFSSRLDEFMRLSHAVIVAPGGIGTLLELVYVWQLIQVGFVEPRPVVLFRREVWQELLDWMRGTLLARGFIGEGDFDWIHCVDTPAEVLAIIEPQVRAFHEQLAKSPGAEEAAREAEAVLREIGRHPLRQSGAPCS